jgi:hypothetical protein
VNWSLVAGDDVETVVDSLAASNRSNDGWARLSVDWGVLDADGDLASVSLPLSQNGTTVDSKSIGSSGRAASGKDRLEEKTGSGSYAVTIAVTDSLGNTDTGSTTLSA